MLDPAGQQHAHFAVLAVVHDDNGPEDPVENGPEAESAMFGVVGHVDAYFGAPVFAESPEFVALVAAALDYN